MLKSEYVLNNDVCLIPRLYGINIIQYVVTLIIRTIKYNYYHDCSGLNRKKIKYSRVCLYNGYSVPLAGFTVIINPRRACAARVTVLGLSFCLSVCLSVCLSGHAILAVRAIKSIMKDTIVLSVRFVAILKWRFS